jgi:hypothetical protein
MCHLLLPAGANRSDVIVPVELMFSEQMWILDVVYHCHKARGSTFLCDQIFIEEFVKLA